MSAQSSRYRGRKTYKEGEMAEKTSRVVELKSIDPWSVFKLTFIACLIIGLIVGIFLAIFGALLMGILGVATADLHDIPFAGGVLGGMGGFAGGLLLGVLLGIVYGVLGGISGAIYALLYDLFAAIAGGIKIRIKE
ncbi:MAG TPA: hypothetical protein ENN07_02765 [candidate division Zixibacteria bacterium]|nr:hypothetical protein [candidate division Zixibacteria bacterium]